MRRIVTALMALLLGACAVGAANPPTTSTATPTSDASATTLVAAPTTQAVVTKTTTPAAVSTITSTGAVTSTTPSPGDTMMVIPYFYVDEPGRPTRTGPFLLPVARTTDRTVAVARAALEELLAGPTRAEAESVPAFSSAIPEGVELLGLTINEDIATVDLSAEFDAADDSATVAQRAAQVVFTLTRFDSVAEVLFRQEGRPVSIQIGDGNLVDRPVGIHDYLEFAAAISVDEPVYGGPASDPLRVTGFAAVFEATFQYALTDGDGLIIEEGVAMTNNGTGWGAFDFTIDYHVDREQLGALIVWANSAENGSRIDVREYPVTLTP